MPDPGTTTPTEAAPAGAAPPVAPEPTAAPAAPAAPETQAPQTREEARRSIRLDQAQRQAKADVTAARAAEAEPAAGGTTPTEAEPAAEPKAEGGEVTETEPGAEPTEGEPGAEPKPEGIVVELDPRHPGTQGLSEIKVANEQEARFIKTLLNSYTRRSEVDTWKAKAEEAEAGRMRERDWRLRQEAVAKVQTNFRSTEEYRANVDEYDRIAQEIGQQAAERYWEGVVAKLAAQSSAEYNERVAAEVQADVDRRGDFWANQMWQRANGLSADITTLPNFRNLFAGAIRSFDAEIIAGTRPDVTAENIDDQFQRFFNGRLLADPSVVATVKARREAKAKSDQLSAEQAEKAKREREAADQAAVDRWKKEQADKRQETPPHALGALGASRDRDTQGGTPAETDDSAGMTAHQFKRSLRRGARQDGRRRFPGT